MANDETCNMYQGWTKQCNQNRIFPNNEKKFYLQVSRKSTKTYEQLNAKKKKKNSLRQDIGREKETTENPNGQITWKRNCRRSTDGHTPELTKSKTQESTKLENTKLW